MTDIRAMVDLPRMVAQLTYPRSNVREPGHYATIRIEDDDSGQLIAEIDLNPDQLFRLMATMPAYGDGRATVAAHRLGRAIQRDVLHLNREEWGLRYDSDETHPAVQAHLHTSREIEGWEVVNYQRKNGQHYIHRTRWLDVPEKEETGEVESAGDGGGPPGA